MLEVFGFVRRRSPALAAEELVAAASLESYEKGRGQLSRRGIELSQSSFLRDIEVIGGICGVADRADALLAEVEQ